MSTIANVPWPDVRIGDVLTYLDERVGLDDSAEYLTITVKRRHGGLEGRERLLGHQIQTKKQFRLIPGAFIISRVQCWHQAYAIVPDDIPPNMIASINYDQFAVSPKVDRRFFWWLSHSPYFTETVRSSAFGVVIEKMVFDREAWLGKKIPLPPLEEQQRIVARVEELAAKIEEARVLRKQCMEESRAFWHSGADTMYRRLRDKFGVQALGMVCHTITDGDHNTPQFSDEGVRFIFVGNVSSGRLHFENCKRVSVDYFKTLKLQRLPERGDILYSAVGATLGIPAVVNSDEAFCFQRHVAILKLDRKQVDSQFAWHMLSSRTIFDKAWASTTGSAQPTVPLHAIRALPIPVPPLSEQLQIVSYLDELQKKTDALKTLQKETSVELDALMPSILDKAFRGEL
jgi:type I restriction enzyme S subunit